MIAAVLDAHHRGVVAHQSHDDEAEVELVGLADFDADFRQALAFRPSRQTGGHQAR